MTDLDEDEQAHLAANIAWLASADPDDWHRAVLDFNWSEPLYLLDWIVRQNDCDVATALTVFWKGEPEAWMAEAGADDDEPNGFSYLNRQLCAYIAARVAAGGYDRSQIAFAPDTWTKQMYVELVACEKELADPNFRAHPELIRNRDGRVVDLNADFYRRYPGEFHLSHYEEQLSDDLADGQAFTAETQAMWQKVQEIERTTAENLPDWLQDQPTTTLVRPDVAAAGDRPERFNVPPLASQVGGPDDEASARIRAIRRNADAQSIAADGQASGLAAWLKRLVHRK